VRNLYEKSSRSPSEISITVFMGKQHNINNDFHDKYPYDNLYI